MAQVAEIHRIPEQVRPAPATRDLSEIIGTEVVERSFLIGRRIEDRASLGGAHMFWTASASCSSRNRKATLFMERRPQDGLCDIIAIYRRAMPLRHADGRICDNADRLRAGVQGGR